MRAVRASGTVKNRMIRCGRPALPQNCATARDRVDIGAAEKLLGIRIAACFGCTATAAASSLS